MMRISEGRVSQVEPTGPSQQVLNSVPVSQSKLEEDFRANEHTSYNRFFLRCIKEFGALSTLRDTRHRCNGDTLPKRYQSTFLEPKNCCIWLRTNINYDFWQEFQREYESLLRKERKYREDTDDYHL